MREKEMLYGERFPELLNIQHKVTSGTEKVTFHLHTDLELIYAISDNLLLCTESQRCPIPSGTLLLINSMTLHHIDYVRDGRPCDRHVLFFKPDLVTGLSLPEFNLLGCFVYHREGFVMLDTREVDMADLLAILDRMEALFQRQRQGGDEQDTYRCHADRLQLRLLLGQALLFVNRLYTERFAPASSPNYEAQSQQVMEVCKYIDGHCDGMLSMDDLSRRFLVSKTQMFNMFKKVLKLSVGEYIAQTRLNQAKNYLINTGYSVEIISQKVGYGSITSFSRVFKNRVGLSPLQYRKQFRQ